MGVNEKAARVWFKLNEGTEVAVKTDGGLSGRLHWAGDSWGSFGLPS